MFLPELRITGLTDHTAFKSVLLFQFWASLWLVIVVFKVCTGTITYSTAVV